MKTKSHVTAFFRKPQFLVLAAIFPLGLPSCSVPDQIPPPPAQSKRMTPEVAARYAPYAMMAENAYYRNGNAPYEIGKLGWRKIKPDGSPAEAGRSSYSNGFGLAADIYRHDKEDRYAFVFCGTNSKKDWLISNLPVGPSFSYKSANKRFKLFLEKQAGGDPRKVVAVGHSLGGGLAGGQSLKFGVDAIMFNTSPRVFDGWGDKWHEKQHPELPKPKRVAIEKSGEFLSAARAVSTKYKEVMNGQRQYYLPSAQGGNAGELHSMSLLAGDIIELAASQDHSLKPFLRLQGDMPDKVP